MEVIIVDSARRHGIADRDILHAYWNPVRIREGQRDLTMHIGFATNGVTILEVGCRYDEEAGTMLVLIVHAMRARPRYLPR